MTDRCFYHDRIVRFAKILDSTVPSMLSVALATHNPVRFAEA